MSAYSYHKLKALLIEGLLELEQPDHADSDEYSATVISHLELQGVFIAKLFQEPLSECLGEVLYNLQPDEQWGYTLAEEVAENTLHCAEAELDELFQAPGWRFTAEPVPDELLPEFRSTHDRLDGLEKRIRQALDRAIKLEQGLDQK